MSPQVPDRLEPDRTVLVVVDIQNKFQDLIYRMDMVLDGTTRLVRFCQELDIPVLVTEHYSKGLGATVDRIQDLFTPHRPIEKIHFSCLGNETFNQALSCGRASRWPWQPTQSAAAPRPTINWVCVA